MEKWHTSPLLHAHSSDAVTQCFYASLKSWRQRRKSAPNSKPPKRRRWFFKLIWLVPSRVRYMPHLQCNPTDIYRLGNPPNSIGAE
jgi:hypothetical protein